MTIMWSVSQSSAWQCPRQWWLSNIARATPAQPEAGNRARGRAIHAAIDRAYRLAVMNSAEGFMVQYLDSAVRLLWRTWGHYQRQDDYNTAVSQLTELFLTLPVPASGAVLGIEKKAVLEHVDQFGTYKINCVMDLVLRTGPTSAHIRDWKSGRIDDDVTDNVQLAVYDLAARTVWPWLTTITVGLYSVRENRETLPVELAPCDRSVCLERLLGDADNAHGALSNAREGVTPGAEAFPTRPGERCSSCVFRSYCPEFTDALLPLRPGLTTGDVIQERIRLARRLESVNR